MDKVIDDNEELAVKKVLVVHPYLNEIGGAEEVLLKIFEALIERKQNCSLLGELPMGSIFDNLPLSSIKQFHYDSDEGFFSNYFRAHRRLLFHHSKLKGKLRKKVGKVDLEISTSDPIYFIGSGKKRVAYVHFPENLTRMQKSDLKSRWFWRLFYWPITFQIKRQVAKTDLLLCNSLYTKEAIMKCWKRVAEVVYPPVDIGEFEPVQKESLVVSVGRFVSSKNYELIVEVAKRLPDVKFVIAGRKRSNENDPYFDKIASLKPDNMTLITDATRANVSALLGRAKIYLHGMVGEHFGISVVEAMAAGCIPVVHNSGGPKETCERIGFFYNDVEDCVKAVSEALQSNVSSDVFVEQAKLFSVDNFKRNFISSLERNGFL
ncbi:MAG: glycosyltransferase [Candidatus Bathyarchaeota archaeon]|uniref:glycosyltransferase n=1 Tax=Candidatus Bathycorpusculum sp. TaxID=2994959 RepID=UPI00282AE3DE|nr:glycosyltransferase [Candidatus Termiticorpusculum sp.]MCL2256977.1 glycosyltransferase [Candidatus Termiticorpusculum sp.]MCL2292899.1 glycosyltransferase [Candidatus Termiticorpusculum sp.]